MNTPRIHSSQSGFTLLEMVVVVGIVATILGSYLAFYKPTQEARATNETKQKIERVLNAVSSFVLMNNRLPCAARPTDAVISGNEPAGLCGTGGVEAGIIPYTALGLSQEDAKDGFGYYMTYIVRRTATSAATAATRADATGSVFCSPSTTLTLRRNGNTENNPYVVIIAHGPQGLGGYNMAASAAGSRSNPLGNLNALGGNTGSGERSNAVDQDNATTDINDYNLQTGFNHFDDVIGYMTGRGIISRLGITYCH
ncbi:MAG TPA: type II secretion system protein [Alphaproteobacteria bacterium]